MKFIILKPTTSSQRHYLNISSKVNKIKVLNSKLKINIFNKKFFKIINFGLNNNTIGIVYSIEYSSNRKSNIASIFNFREKLFFYIIAPKNLKIGNIIKIGEEAEKKIGHCMKLNKIPIGCPIFNVSLKSISISRLSRSAGTFSLLLDKNKRWVNLMLNSGKRKLVSINCYGYVGVTSNEFLFLKQLGKAGRQRWLGNKPLTKGVAMNPVDHPNGGGEGHKSSKNKNPWGKVKNSRKTKFFVAK